MIIPTILEKDKNEIIRNLRLLENYAQIVQIDLVEPGVFKGETFLEIDYLEDLSLKCNIELDLMVRDPVRFVNKKSIVIKKVAANINCENLDEFVSVGIDNGFIVGVTFNPHTDFVQYSDIIDRVDFVEFITVEPGGQNRTLVPECLDTIKKFIEQYPDIPLQVDGGIKLDNLDLIKKLGVTNFVVGSAIVKQSDPVLEFQKFKERLING